MRRGKRPDQARCEEGKEGEGFPESFARTRMRCERAEKMRAEAGDFLSIHIVIIGQRAGE